MELHLMCLTQSGSLPIFTKKIGNCQNLPFSTVASLNSTNIFCKSQGIQLNTTYANDWTLIWRDYYDSITLIAAGKDSTEKQLNSLTDLIYHSFLLFINPSDLHSSNVFEKMKREAKNYMPIVDKILDTFEKDLLNYNECLLSNDNFHILQRLNEFSLKFGFCAITIEGKIAVASEGWWDLDILDRKLLILLLNSSPTGGQNDIAVFLPNKSPQTAYRFVTVPLTPIANLCVICGAEPPYSEINILSQQIFHSDLNLLLSAESCIPNNFPISFEFDSNILGVLLINKITKKFVISKNLQPKQRSSCTGSIIRLDILRKFFHETVHNLYKNLNEKFITISNENQITEQYSCISSYKCHSFNYNNDNLICILYHCTLPIYEMRLITKHTVTKLLADTTICW